jgi:hypothetical protein
MKIMLGMLIVIAIPVCMFCVQIIALGFAMLLNFIKGMITIGGQLTVEREESIQEWLDVIAMGQDDTLRRIDNWKTKDSAVAARDWMRERRAAAGPKKKPIEPEVV